MLASYLSLSRPLQVLLINDHTPPIRRRRLLFTISAIIGQEYGEHYH